MGQAAATLIDFFGLEKKHLEDKRSGMEATPTFEFLKETLAREVKDVLWPTAYETIASKIDALLGVRLSDIMIGAWKKLGILIKYSDPEKYGPEETFLIPLAEHTITSSHKPYIIVIINGLPAKQINFSITLSLILKGFVLKVQDGKIKEIQTGTCQGKGVIKCEEVTIMEKQTDTCRLPGVIHLGDGIPIID